MSNWIKNLYSNKFKFFAVLTIAALLILAVLYLFLRDWRAALIAFSAIPLSLLAAVAVLDHLGYTLNTMTLGGFAVALGVLVDDAIIGVENVLRRLAIRSRPADRQHSAGSADQTQSLSPVSLLQLRRVWRRQ